ncbi:MAG: citrate (Si)-synthase [Bacteroidota bacterium]
MDMLKERFKEKASTLAKEVKALVKEHGHKTVGDVSLRQVFGGMRGVKSMIWETSNLDAQEGIRFRGYSIPELKKVLPTREGDSEPLPEGLFWLMLVDEVPTVEQVNWLSDEWERRGAVPQHTFDMLDALPADTHPMAQFSAAIISMESESIFSQRYAEGMSKYDYWDATYEDTMNLIAKLPRVAAYIYRKSFHNNEQIAPDNSLDWAANYAHQLGIEDPEFKSLMRLYLTIHADHEGGNASAHTAHLVGSTLSSAYLSFAGGMTSLAGPLHGLANQEVLKFILEMIDALGTDDPTKEQIADYVQKTLDGGKVIPGYGHAVLRQPDPRFTAQKVFAEQYLQDSKIVNIVWKLFDVVPPILQGLGKVKNPWPNVDAHSGALLTHYGLTEYSYYTVLFGVSRALGVLAAMCWSRALGFPLERPKSVTMDWVREFISNN